MNNIYLEKAEKNFIEAQNLLKVTYPAICEPKLFLSIINCLYFAYYYGIIGKFTETNKNDINIIEIKSEIMLLKIINKWAIENKLLDYIKEMNELNIIKNKHKNSPIEFQKKDKYIICSEDYSLTIISSEELKKRIIKAKLFIDDLLPK
jgi:hypothetical protein